MQNLSRFPPSLPWRLVHRRSFSQRLVQSQLAHIRRTLQQSEQDETQQFEKESYLQRIGLSSPNKILSAHPILLHKRSLSDIKNLCHLLTSRCGLPVTDALLSRHPSLIELDPDTIAQALHRLKTLGFTNHSAFTKIEPSLLFSSSSHLLDRLSLYIEVFIEIGLERSVAVRALERRCVHALQREPKDVFASLKCFEQIGVDLRSLLRAHPQSLVYSKAHIEKVRIFIAREVSDLRGVDVRVLQRCPQILAVNLAKAKATLRWLRSADLLSVSQILEQCPALLARVDAQRMAQTLQCLMGAHIGKGAVRQNLWLLTIRKESVDKRVAAMEKFGVALSEANVEMLRYDHTQIARLLKEQQRQRTTD